MMSVVAAKFLHPPKGVLVVPSRCSFTGVCRISEATVWGLLVMRPLHDYLGKRFSSVVTPSSRS